MWEVCPMCKGSGEAKTLDGKVFNSICPVCNGQRIINELTGRPPSAQPLPVVINAPVITAPWTTPGPATCQPSTIAPPKYDAGIQCDKDDEHYQHISQSR